MAAQCQLVARQLHRGQGGSQKPASGLQNPATTRKKNVLKLRSDDQSIIGRRRQLTKDPLLIRCGNTANGASRLLRATFVQERDCLDSGYSAEVLQKCREH